MVWNSHESMKPFSVSRLDRVLQRAIVLFCFSSSVLPLCASAFGEMSRPRCQFMPLYYPIAFELSSTARSPGCWQWTFCASVSSHSFMHSFSEKAMEDCRNSCPQIWQPRTQGPRCLPLSLPLHFASMVSVLFASATASNSGGKERSPQQDSWTVLDVTAYMCIDAFTCHLSNLLPQLGCADMEWDSCAYFDASFISPNVALCATASIEGNGRLLMWQSMGLCLLPFLHALLFMKNIGHFGCCDHNIITFLLFLMAAHLNNTPQDRLTLSLPLTIG